MGKSFKRNDDGYEYQEHQKKKFNSRRNKRLEKIEKHFSTDSNNQVIEDQKEDE